MPVTGLMFDLENDLEQLDHVNQTVSALSAALIQQQKVSPEQVLIHDVQTAYLIQKSVNDIYIRSFNTKQSGWKVALSGQSAQQKYGIQYPVYGRLYHSVEYLQHAKLQQLKDEALKLEVELAFSLKYSLDKTQYYSDEELIAAIDEIRPALEIANVRWQHWNMSVSQFIADNAAAGFYILGQPIDLDLIALKTAPTDMLQDIIQDSNVEYLLTTTDQDHPIANYLWLIRELLAQEQNIEQGQMILTGSFIRPMPLSYGYFEFTILDQKLALTVV